MAVTEGGTRSVDYSSNRASHIVGSFRVLIIGLF